jgi:hypothetical protein
MDIAEREGRPIVPLDMNDQVYTEAYCDKVTTVDMIRESLFARGLPGSGTTSPAPPRSSPSAGPAG